MSQKYRCACGYECDANMTREERKRVMATNPCPMPGGVHFPEPIQALKKGDVYRLQPDTEAWSDCMVLEVSGNQATLVRPYVLENGQVGAETFTAKIDGAHGLHRPGAFKLVRYALP